MKSRDAKDVARLIVTSGPSSDARSGASDIGAPAAGSSGAGAYALPASALLPSAHEPLGDGDYRSALQLEHAEHEDASISLYVHLPFCPSRCLTCDQHSTVSHDTREIDRYLDTLEREVTLVADPLGGRRQLQQLHLGGGTPNYLSDIQLARLVDIIEQRFVINSETEASLEANAQRASHTQLALLHGLGFRSLNLEVRDLDAHVQQALGRSQSLPIIRDVVDSARDIGFDRIGTDLVYGLPRQTVASMERTLSDLLSINPDRISCSAFQRRADSFEHQRAIDSADLPSLGDRVAMFSRIVDALCGDDYQWIGLDCFARPHDPIVAAQEAGTLHRNWIGYTPHAGRRVLGIGNSSVSDLTSIRVRNHTSVDRWQYHINRGELPVAEGEILDRGQRAQRYALSDLMCNLQSNAVEPLFGNDDNAVLHNLVDEGLLERDDDTVAVTERGRFMLHGLWGDSSPAERWACAI
jgi:oxygen-independent coproporphyrinogen-3 oxidase